MFVAEWGHARREAVYACASCVVVCRTGTGFRSWQLVSASQSTSSGTLEECTYKRAIDSTAQSLRALGALRTAAVALPHLGALADDSRASAGRLLLSILRGAAAQSPLLSGDPNTHVGGVVASRRSCMYMRLPGQGSGKVEA